MKSVIFNSLDYSNKLQEAGVEKKQADAHALAMYNLFENNIATKTDLLNLEQRLDTRIDKMEIEMKSMEKDIIIKIGGIIIGASTLILGTIIKIGLH